MAGQQQQLAFAACFPTFIREHAAAAYNCIINGLQVQVEGKTATECTKEDIEECASLRYALFVCRRGQVDARTRIQGNKGY